MRPHNIISTSQGLAFGSSPSLPSSPIYAEKEGRQWHMKNLLAILGLIVLFAIGGCQKDEPHIGIIWEETSEDIVKNGIECSPEETKIELSFTIDRDKSIDATTEEDWISATISKNTNTDIYQLLITVSQNDNPTERKGSVVLRQGRKSTEIHVTQKGKYYIKTEMTKCQFPADGGNYDIKVKANGTLKAIVR